MTSHYKVPTHELDAPVTVLAFNEVQHIVLTGVSASTFTLNFDGEVTANISGAATAAAVQAALEKLSNIQPGDVAVTGANGGPFDVTFTGEYAGVDVPTLVGTAAAGSITITVATAGGPNPQAVQFGTGDADARDRTNPLDGLSPAAQRAAHKSEYGDS